MRIDAKVLPIAATPIILMAILGCSDRAGPQVSPGEVHDAGPVFVSTSPILTHRFLVTNTTGVAVRITGENHSCSCTKVELEPMTLEPGASTPLTMAVSVPQGYAKSDLSCVVLTNHPQFPNWIYHLRFEGYPDARIIPDRVDLGSRQPGRPGNYPKAARLEVFAPTGKNFPSLGSGSSSGGLAVRVGERGDVETLSGGVRRERYPLDISIKPYDGLLGPRSENFNIGVGGGLPASVAVQWTASFPLESFPA